MKNKVLNIILNIVTLFVVTMFFSCNSNLKEAQKLTLSENEPVGVAKNINLKHTDSGKLSANLLSPKMLDFTNRDFGFNEFPEGITLYLYDDSNNKSKVVSDYAIVYNETNLIDLQGNVVIKTYDGRVLKTNQLFYDSKKEWVFTNTPVNFTTNEDVMYGNGFDSNSKFTNAEVLEVTGIFSVEEE